MEQDQSAGLPAQKQWGGYTTHAQDAFLEREMLGKSGLEEHKAELAGLLRSAVLRVGIFLLIVLCVGGAAFFYFH